MIGDSEFIYYYYPIQLEENKQYISTMMIKTKYNKYNIYNSLYIVY